MPALLPCVMLVDDDATTNFINQTLLTRLGVAERLLLAHNGFEALNYLAEHCVPPGPNCPALILLDINMPRMSGVEFLEAYRPPAPTGRPAMVIVMLTTSLHPHDVGRVEQMGMVDGFLSKPLTAAKVDQLLQTHFNLRLPKT